MKSVINETDVKAPFPKLVKHDGTGSIFVFTAPGKGMLLHKGEGDTHNTVADHRDNWVKDMKDFHGSLTLSNDCHTTTGRRGP